MSAFGMVIASAIGNLIKARSISANAAVMHDQAFLHSPALHPDGCGWSKRLFKKDGPFRLPPIIALERELSFAW
ncbi:hypothetical protein CQ14_21260 [Bradyrhizobium lablabi]|uniref:Uncharacterized protein n=1 Tax=Bradyrhizobium lablabi TaxID=722472 RepID=A0A0R3N7F2_9BRAD|nr:hypothetical protein CQ14_21260 [Bradyrhizobium lablabi]